MVMAMAMAWKREWELWNLDLESGRSATGGWSAPVSHKSQASPEAALLFFILLLTSEF